MSKKVLVIKKAGGLQTLQTVGAGAKPKFFDTMRTAFGRGSGKLNRAGALLGLGLKGAAGAGAVVNTAKRMQSGDFTAPLQAGQEYESLDPTSFLSGSVQGGLENQQKFQSQQNRNSMPQSTHAERMGGYTTGSNPNRVGVRAKGPARFNVPKPGDSKPARPSFMDKPKGPANVAVRQPGQTQPPRPSFMDKPTSPNVGGQTRGPAPVNRAVPPGMPGTVGNAFGSAISPAYPQTTTSHPMAVQQQPVQQPMQQQQPMTPQVMGDAMNQHMQPPQGMAAQPAQPAQSPMDLAMASLRTNAEMPSYQQQGTTPTSTTNPLSPSNLNNANSVLDSYYNTLPQGQQAQGGAVQGQLEGLGNFGTNPESWGQKPDLNQGLGQHQTTWSQSVPQDMWKAMLKAYVKQLYDEFGGYLYKMTPHEAGQFAVYTMFTLRK